MFFEDIDRKSIFKNLIFFLCFSAFFVLFGAVYELFSYGVYSYFMLYAFAYPLVLGVFPYLLIGLFGKRLPTKLSKNCWNFGIITLTVGSIVNGIYDISGAESFTVLAYYIAGGLLLAIGLITHISMLVKNK